MAKITDSDTCSACDKPAVFHCGHDRLFFCASDCYSLHVGQKHAAPPYRHPYSRIRQALICADCGEEVQPSHILGDPTRSVSFGALGCQHGRPPGAMCPHCAGVNR